ncbi:MAG TPA: sugar transferase [Azospirillum sp.]
MDAETAFADRSACPTGARPEGVRVLRRAFREFAAAGLVLMVGDMLLIGAAISLATLLRGLLTDWFPIGIDARVFLGLHILVVLLPLGFAMAGLYPGYGRTDVERLRLRVTATAVCFGALLIFDYLAQNGQWSRGITLASAVLTLLVLPVWDGVARSVMVRRGLWGTPVVVLGPSERRGAVVQSLTSHAELGWIPVVEGPLPRPGEPMVPGATVAIVVLPLSGPAVLPDDLPYRRVVLVPAVDDVQSSWVAVRDMGMYVGLEMQRNLLIPFNRKVKRLLDLALATTGLVFALPVIALFALLVKIVSPGPAFFIQAREGCGGRSFRMWKLRTMVPDADQHLDVLLSTSAEANREWSQHMKLRTDPRVIPAIGRLMRRFSIDELPQLWNVIRGDMSVVGPRPLPDYHLAALDPTVYALRRRVRPGITGLWQVSGRSSRPLDEQQRLDAYYVRNWSLWLDLHILARTVVEVLKGKGAW